MVKHLSLILITSFVTIKICAQKVSISDDANHAPNSLLDIHKSSATPNEILLNVGTNSDENVFSVDEAGNTVIDGNVGIGTENPQSKLDVNGKVTTTELEINDQYSLPTTAPQGVKVLKYNGSNVIWDSDSKLQTIETESDYTVGDSVGYIFVTGSATITLPIPALEHPVSITRKFGSGTVKIKVENGGFINYNDTCIIIDVIDGHKSFIFKHDGYSYTIISSHKSEITTKYTIVEESDNKCTDALTGKSMFIDVPISFENFIEVKVKPEQPGPYSIKSSTRSGITFINDGIFIDTNIRAVRLYPVGEDENTGWTSNSFYVYGSENLGSCFVPYYRYNSAIVELGTSNCTNYSSGTFYGDLTYTSQQNYGRHITISNINVTQAGYVKFRTDTVNGYYFVSDIKYLSVGMSPYVQVRLYPRGKAIVSDVTNTLKIKVENELSGTGECFFTNYVTNGLPPAANYQIDYDCNASTSKDVNFIVGESKNDAYFDLRVLVNSPGSYQIRTDTVNGIHFEASGIFNSAGAQNVRLYCPSVTPSNPGEFSLTTYGNGSGTCNKQVFVNTNYSINCFGTTGSNKKAHGSYSAGVEMTSENYINVALNFSNPNLNNYEIISDTVNGIYFYTQGSTGGSYIATSQKIYAYGTPVSDGSFTYNLSNGYFGSCQMTIDFFDYTFGLGCLTNQYGFFEGGEALTSDEVVVATVNVNKLGPYNMNSNTVNGYNLSSSGVFTTTGEQSVVLQANGTPINGHQLDILTISADNGETCATLVEVFDGTAIYSVGNGGTCGAISVNGNYQSGNSLNATHYIRIQVSVTETGPFTISTNTVNGYSFSATGSFASTGTQYVDLLSSGTPSNGPQTNNFTISGSNGSGGCTFNVNVF